MVGWTRLACVAIRAYMCDGKNMAGRAASEVRNSNSTRTFLVMMLLDVQAGAKGVVRGITLVGRCPFFTSEVVAQTRVL